MQQFNDTYDDGFSGGGLATLGAIAAGLKPIHAVEYDAAIADVYRRNIGDRVLVRPIQEVDWTALPVPYWRHMSPVCTRASQANSNGEESDLDLEMARAVARSIAVHPPMFSLENVWQYRNFESFKIILRALRKHGYNYNYWHLNAADYGVPQTRKRLILVASRIREVRKPVPTHAERDADTGQLAMFEPLPAWVGWYQAIEDLIPTLPDSEFAPWQLERLPEELTTCLVGEDSKMGTVNDSERWFTIVASQRSRNTRAFIMDGTEMRGDGLTRSAVLPSHTVKAAHWKGMPRAFLVDGDGNRSRTPTVLEDTDPSMTVQAWHGRRPIQAPRALLVHSTDQRSMPTREADEPAFTVMAYSFDKSHQPGGKPRAWLQHGRVVKMIPRALARFQSVPDTYELPDKDSLACTVIGNGVPCRLMEAVINANR